MATGYDKFDSEQPPLPEPDEIATRMEAAGHSLVAHARESDWHRRLALESAKALIEACVAELSEECR